MQMMRSNTNTDTSHECFKESVPVYRMFIYNFKLNIRLYNTVVPQEDMKSKSRNKVTDGDIRDIWSSNWELSNVKSMIT